MARYEGMDDLLHRVRERLGVNDSGNAPQVPAPPMERKEQYAIILEALLLVLRDADALRELIELGPLYDLTPEQHEDLLAILGKVLRELYGCKTALEVHQPAH